jgi:uncharacterized membrane protein
MQVRTIRSIVYLGAGLGIIVSIFAALETYTASLRGICSINSFFSCSKVDTSGLTSTFGIPDYLIGVLGFILIFIVAAIAESRPRDRRWEYLLVFVTTAGLAVAAYFVYVELALIGAFCVVCGASYAMGLVAWGGSLGLLRVPPDQRRRASKRAADDASDE